MEWLSIHLEHLLFSIEKDLHETSTAPQKNTSHNPDYHQKIQILKEKFEKCREHINKLHGIELTKEEQLKKVEVLGDQLKVKRQLLLRYKHHCPITEPTSK